MASGPPLHIGKPGKKTPLQLARVVVKMHVDARDIVHEVEVIGLFHIGEP